jgi:hypothetical protein
MKNTRQAVRVRRRLLVRLGWTSSFTLDVCRGGFGIGLMRVLPAHALLEGSILVDGWSVPFAAEVAWSKPGDRCLGLPGRMGVVFRRVADGFASAIDPAPAERATGS